MTDAETTNRRTVDKLREALEHNLCYQEAIQSNINKLNKIMISNSEKQRLLKSKLSKYDLHTFITAPRGPKRPDFFRIPHWTFNTMDRTTGTIAPKQTNIDIQKYKKKLGNFQFDHTHLKFSLTEQRALSKALANTIRLFYLEDLHKKHCSNPRLLQDELNKIRIRDSTNELWPLKYWNNYPISWQRTAKDNMTGRTASECQIFWNGHLCSDNPSINRNKTWNKEENNKLMQIVEQNEEKDWKCIAQQHNNKRTALQCVQQWMRKLKPRATLDRKWSTEEDETLKSLVCKHGKNNFLYIGSHFENRSALQCASRWLKSTAPYIQSGEWNEIEDIQCVLSHNAYLPKVIPIIQSLTSQSVQKKKKDKKKKNTQSVLAPRSGKHGVWVLIGRHITFRNDVKARERYMNVLDPSIDIQSQWTIKEDNDLIKYHEEYGDKWAFIARKMGGKRTDCYCRQRFKALNKKRKRKRNTDINNAEDVDVSQPKKKRNIDIDVSQPINAESRVITRSKAKSVEILKLPETFEFAEKPHKKRKKPKRRKKSSVSTIKIETNKLNKLFAKKGSKPIYLENDFSSRTNTTFIGRRPNKFIVNQPQDTLDRYIVPRKSNGDDDDDAKYEMLSMHNKYIDEFVEKEREKMDKVESDNGYMITPSLSGQTPIISMPSFPEISPMFNPYETSSNTLTNNIFKINGKNGLESSVLKNSNGLTLPLLIQNDNDCDK